MVEIVNSIITVILTSVTSYVIWLMQNYKKNKSLENEALKMILKAWLKDLYQEYMSAGKISLEDYDDYREMYEAYHNLGGNGTGTHMMEKINKLKGC